jgi:hypothetical protein
LQVQPSATEECKEGKPSKLTENRPKRVLRIESGMTVSFDNIRSQKTLLLQTQINQSVISNNQLLFAQSQGKNQQVMSLNELVLAKALLVLSLLVRNTVDSNHFTSLVAGTAEEVRDSGMAAKETPTKQSKARKGRLSQTFGRMSTVFKGRGGGKQIVEEGLAALRLAILFVCSG